MRTSMKMHYSIITELVDLDYSPLFYLPNLLTDKYSNSIFC